MNIRYPIYEGVYRILTFPLVAPATFGPDLIMSPRKVSWLFMQGFTIKYYPCGAKGGDFVVNRQSLTLHTRMT